MDEVSEQSPLLMVILLWDKVESFFSQHPWLLFRCSLLLACLFTFGSRTYVYSVIAFLLWFNLNHVFQALYDVIATWLGITIAVTCAMAALGIRLDVLQLALQTPTATCSSDASPYLIPSRTTHSRLVPKKHSFSYSYLLAGIPIGLDGSINGIISTRSSNSIAALRRAWYTVDPADYLQRGLQHLGLRGKLDDYLKSQAVDPSLYPHAYLVTAPRFFGYHFNPVSFWYLYSPEKVLSAIVAEVNNTFGERRPYLCVRDLTVTNSVSSVAEVGSHSSKTSGEKFAGTMEKDFHVSPFNSRNGSYSLSASDPLGKNLKSFRGIDVTINLISSKGQPKIVARLFSEGDAIDPTAVGPLDMTRFLLKWFWVGFATFPRIVKEAGVLFFQRKLHVWYRPEPLKDSLARHADKTERDLETVFRIYLQHLVENSTFPVAIKYVPSGLLTSEPETFTSQAAKRDPAGLQLAELRVLTPIFYSRFVSYAHDFEAIFCEMAESCTVWADQPDILPKVFFKKASPPLHAATLSDFLAFKALHRLRKRPEAIKRPLTSAHTTTGPPPNTRVTDIRDFRMSSMDAFVLDRNDPNLKSTYKSTLLRLFIADRISLGSVELLDWAEAGLGLISAWLVAGLFQTAIETAKDPWR